MGKISPCSAKSIEEMRAVATALLKDAAEGGEDEFDYRCALPDRFVVAGGTFKARAKEVVVHAKAILEKKGATRQVRLQNASITFSPHVGVRKVQFLKHEGVIQFTPYDAAPQADKGSAYELIELTRLDLTAGTGTRPSTWLKWNLVRHGETQPHMFMFPVADVFAFLAGPLLANIPGTDLFPHVCFTLALIGADTANNKNCVAPDKDAFGKN